MQDYSEPYEDTYLKERIQTLISVQAEALAQGKRMACSYEYLWLPGINDLPDISYQGHEAYRAPYGTFHPHPRAPFHGAMLFSLLKIINAELVRNNAGVYVWRVEAVQEPSAEVQHLYPDGLIPALSNAHTRADVTGYALLEEQAYQADLIYIGLAAHKTSMESLWASLIRGRGGCSLRGTSILPDGEIKMLTQPLSDYGVLHAGILCRKALPGQWEPQDEAAYALAFEARPDVESALRALALKRLQEALPFPILDAWGKDLWDYALDAGYLKRLETGGDCRGGVKIDLLKPWQELVQNLLDQDVLKM